MATSMVSSLHSGMRRRVSTVAQAQPNGTNKGNVVIVGAGPAGCLMAAYCVRRGFHVHLFEKRDSSTDDFVGNDSRSYTMLLTCRAVRALEAADIQVPASLMGPLLGGCVHLPNGKMRVFRYYSESGLVSYGVSRQSFVRYLQQTLLERYPDNVSAHFGWELVTIRDDECLAKFQAQDEAMEVKYDLLVGADGVSSKTRAEMLRLEQNESKTSPLTLDFIRNPERYKSFYIRPSLAKCSPLYAHHNYVQSWPALNMLLVGMADGSFWGGSKNLELMNASSPSEVDQLFRTKAPEVHELLLKQSPNFPNDYLKQPAISFGGSVILSRFHRRNIVLVGDAAHAMFPSYGSGCNVALEDCLLFDQILEEQEKEGNINFSKAAEEFTRRRVDDAHAIVEMNTDMRLLPRGFLGILQTTLLMTLRKFFPSLTRPTSYQLLWSHVPFTKIKEQKFAEDVFFYTLLGVLVVILATVVVYLLK